MLAPILFYLLVGLLFIRSLGDPFFWDGVQLGAKQAWFYYDKAFQSFWLPEEIDSGHPPFFGIYLAFIWQCFGASLLVSHLAMFPFILLFCYASWQLGQHYLGPRWGFLLPGLFLADPTLLSQLFLLGPDVALLAFFLLAFLGLSQKKSGLQMLGILGLGLISMRGMMVAFALFLFEILSDQQERKWNYSWLWKKIKVYVPGGMVALLFLFFHFREKGWVGYHATSPWAGSFQKNTVAEAVLHLLILGWRLIDFGRLFFWLAILLLLASSSKIKKWPANTVLAILLFLGLSWPFLLYDGLNQHRYLLPFYLLANLVFLQLICRIYWKPRQKVLLFNLVFLGFMTGHFWVYPSSVAQGWDSSLAHRPYFSLRNDTEDFLIGEGIPLEKVGTTFPAIGPLRNYNPGNSGAGFSDKNEKNYDYYFISNIMNDYSKKELRALKKEYQLLFHRQQRGIYVSIYGKKEKKPGRFK